MAGPVRMVRVVVKGRVQGVYYRAWTAEVARELGLAGWVRNRHDGTVEALFAGATDAVETMLDRCREGPRAAKVTGIAIEEQDGAAAPDGFEIRPRG